jgi:hypothetical protein
VTGHNNSPTEWIIAQRDGVQNGKIRGPRGWISDHARWTRAAGHAGATIEHSWAVMFTTIGDEKKRSDVDMARMTGKLGPVECDDRINDS